MAEPRTFPRLCLGLAAALLLSACIPELSLQPQSPAPAIQYGLVGGAESAGMHTVTDGETVYQVAERYRLSMQDIVRINHLQPPYALKPGARIKLPPPLTYTARQGDTLYSVSRLFDVSTTDLAHLNNLFAPYNVTPGQALRLPAAPVYAAAKPARRPLWVLTKEEREGLPVQPVIASATARPSTPIVQPDMGQAPVEESVPQGIAAPPATVTAETLAPLPGQASGRIQAETLAPPPAMAQQQVASVPATPLPKLPADTPARSGSRFAWPVSGGRVISGYGDKAGGLHNDGINIRAPKGAPVRAAENGVVVYADDQLKGFGNLVLIRHADRWLTAYAHLNGIKVKRGDVIRRGAVVGTVGDTGGVDGPQLHFEIRHGTEALNPQAYLDGQAKG